MSFHFHNEPFWGLLVISGEREIAAEKPEPHLFRPRLVAQWLRAADGRLERRWRHQPINLQSK